MKRLAQARGWVVADTPATRLRGLLGLDRLCSGEAIVLWPCAAVHTFGMRFAIDVVFVDRSLRVCAVRPNVPARRFAAHWRAWAVIELASGEAARIGLAPGVPVSALDVDHRTTSLTLSMEP